METDLISQIISSTVRLQTETSTGTGFFYRMNVKSNGDFKPVIVTNRHVLEDADELKIRLRCNKEGVYVNHDFEITNLKGNVIYHPDESIDLAVFPMPGLIKYAREVLGMEPEVYFFDENAIPNETEIKNLSAVEDVIVVGYPNGLWDSVNVKPLVRRGITASDYKLDYEGKPHFIIDSAIYPGSSGSPVFYYSKGTHIERNNVTLGGLRLKFLGINSSVFIQGVTGDLIQTNQISQIKSYTNIPINLGIIIKANQLKVFEPLLPD